MSVDALHGPMFPAQGKATAAVVMLHGYGSNGDDLIGLAPLVARALPHAVFYSPNAPTPIEGPWAGYQWFSLEGYTPEALDTEAARNRLSDALHGRASRPAQTLDTYLDQVLAHHGIPAARLALLGFSQGTMMALQVGLRRRQQLAGIVGYSGMLMKPDLLRQEIASRPPVLLIHGEDDPVVPVTSLHDAETALKAVAVPTEAHVIPGLQHGIDESGLALGLKFLRDKLG